MWSPRPPDGGTLPSSRWADAAVLQGLPETVCAAYRIFFPVELSKFPAPSIGKLRTYGSKQRLSWHRFRIQVENIANFPSFFPVNQRKSAETGSHQTFCTAIKSRHMPSPGSVGVKRLQADRRRPWPRRMKNPFRSFSSSPEIIRLTVPICIRYPLLRRCRALPAVPIIFPSFCSWYALSAPPPTGRPARGAWDSDLSFRP